MAQHMKLRRIGAAIIALGVTYTTATADHARAAVPLPDVVDTIAHSGGHYVWGGITLDGTDCSGLVGNAQTLAMGQPPHRLGDTHDLLAGNWPGVIPGATPDDQFIIGVSLQHMVARIDGVNIEARAPGEPYRIGPAAVSPFDPQFTRQYHLDPNLLETA